MNSLPFWLRRPFLLIRDLRLNRRQPKTAILKSIEDPEDFVWSILPHAARTFSPCIILLPRRWALPCAVAYLYCRSLDTCEDLITDAKKRDEALAQIARRVKDLTASPDHSPPSLDLASVKTTDAPTETHRILLEHLDRVDRVFVALPDAVRHLISNLVADMAKGMRWSSSILTQQRGIFADSDQLGRYCRAVLGNPILFTVRLTHLLLLGNPDVSPQTREDAMAVGEFLQLANVTRDIEDDLTRGVAYDPALAELISHQSTSKPRAKKRIAEVRASLMDQALLHAKRYPSLVKSLPLKGFSLTRASAVLMLLFTERYWYGCARRAGRTAPRRSPSGWLLLLKSVPSIFSARAAHRRLAASVSGLGTLA